LEPSVAGGGEAGVGAAGGTESVLSEPPGVLRFNTGRAGAAAATGVAGKVDAGLGAKALGGDTLWGAGAAGAEGGRGVTEAVCEWVCGGVAGVWG